MSLKVFLFLFRLDWLPRGINNTYLVLRQGYWLILCSVTNLAMILFSIFCWLHFYFIWVKESWKGVLVLFSFLRKLWRGNQHWNPIREAAVRIPISLAGRTPLGTNWRAEAHFRFSGAFPGLPPGLHFPWLPPSPVAGTLLELVLGNL